MVFTMGLEELDDSREVEFEDFLEVALGHSVVSAASWGPHRLELGLSGKVMLRVFWRADGLEVNLVATGNPREAPPLTIKFEDGHGPMPVRTLEQRFRGLRQLYALALLDQRDRTDVLYTALSSGASFDIDDLIDADDQLLVESSSTGSWYITLWCKVKDNYAALLRVAALMYGRGREAFLRKIEAEAELKQLEVDEKRFRLDAARLDYGFKILKDAPNEQTRQVVEQYVTESVRLALGPGAPPSDVEQSSRKLLGPPTGPYISPLASPAEAPEQVRAREMLLRHSQRPGKAEEE